MMDIEEIEGLKRGQDVLAKQVVKLRAQRDKLAALMRELALESNWRGVHFDDGTADIFWVGDVTMPRRIPALLEKLGLLEEE